MLLKFSKVGRCGQVNGALVPYGGASIPQPATVSEQNRQRCVATDSGRGVRANAGRGIPNVDRIFNPARDGLQNRPT
jgi:hypothetical protein